MVIDTVESRRNESPFGKLISSVEFSLLPNNLPMIADKA